MAVISSPIAVFVVDFLRGYGSERYTVQLVNALARREQAVDLILQKKGDTLIKDVDTGVRVIEIGTRNPFATIWFLTRYLKTTSPRAFFTIMEKPSLLGIVASALVRYRKIVPTVHFDIDAYAELEYGARRKILRLLVAFFYRYAPVVVAVSSGVAKTLQRWIGAKTRVVTILNGFDLKALRQRSMEQVAFPWLVDKTVPVVMACGRFVPLKGFDTLIKAFAQVRRKTAARLIILGQGELHQDMQKLIASLGLHEDVALPGYVSNPQAWFARSDVFVLSSRSEGFGNVLVEALASGVKVVSSDCPSGPREIVGDGRYGALVPVDDVEAMAEAIQAALDLSGEATARAETQKHLDAHFSLDKMADSYLAVVESLAA